MFLPAGSVGVFPDCLPAPQICKTVFQSARNRSRGIWKWGNRFYAFMTAKEKGQRYVPLLTEPDLDIDS